MKKLFECLALAVTSTLCFSTFVLGYYNKPSFGYQDQGGNIWSGSLSDYKPKQNITTIVMVLKWTPGYQVNILPWTYI